MDEARGSSADFGSGARPGAAPVSNRILVADADPIQCEVARGQLTGLGFQVISVGDGLSAREHLMNGDIRLAVVSLGMAGLDGVSLIAALRGDPATHDLPVIVVTARDDMAAIERAYGAGATAFMTKPVNWALFEKQVRFVLRAADQERDLRLARHQAEAASRRKDDLLSIITHELRTPLHVISGFADLLAREVDGPLGQQSYKSYADQILEASQGFGRLMSDMLVYSRALAGKLEVAEGEWPLKRVIRPVIERHDREAGPRGIIITCGPIPDDLELVIDRELIGRALDCLVDNAIKFSPSDARVRIEWTQTASGASRISVQDQGAGIPVADLARVTEPFFQSDMSLARRANGLGLGLTLAKIAVEAHGGALEIQSQVGAGTTASLVLPPGRVVRFD